MSDAAAALRAPDAPDRIAREPWFGHEARPPRTDVFDAAWSAAGALLLAGRTGARGRSCRRIVAAAERAGADLAGLDDADLARRARTAGRAARLGEPGALTHAGPLFALVREAAGRSLGLRHYPVQLMGGYALLRGWLAEMHTGEGKTLTATLAAAAMALAGRPVHVVTVNDYLARRDAEEMTPVYRALGLSVGLVVQGMAADDRRRAYACDVTYCTNKELAFDFLKDRIAPGAAQGRLTQRVRAAHAEAGRAAAPLLRGLAFALVDEADSVLIDEARTPLILSGQGPASFDPALLDAARRIAAGIAPGGYRLDRALRSVELTPAGIRWLAGVEGAGLLANRSIREDLVVKALTAAHLFHRDEHYLLRDGKVEIIDEYTGRVMPDRFWSDGLHQMIELKEGLPPSGGRVTLARTTYQRFFRRYDRLAGMSGTVREVAGELWRTYGLAVAAIPTHRPLRRRTRATRVFATAAAKWAAIAAEAERLQRAGLPVLIGTRSVAASKVAAEALAARGVAHRLLSAEQDAAEAAVIGAAGQAAVVTVATNMAGRGADIRLSPEVRAAGGLHVLMSEAHDSRRIDRQLAGRAGRQGDPGSFQALLSLEDPLVAGRAALARRLPLPALARAAIRRAQIRAETTHARMRRDLQRQDEVLNDAMAFAGVPD
jgi:preprotein translocase subunit SecA